MSNTLTVKQVKTGRRSSITRDHIYRLEQCFEYDTSISDACLMSGVSRDAYYRRLKTDSDFRIRMELAQIFLKCQAKQILFAKMINEHDVKIARWYLEHRDPQFMPSAKVVIFNGQIGRNWSVDQLYKLQDQIGEVIEMRLNDKPEKWAKDLLRQLKRTVTK